jgi:hypothetical protein
LRLEPPQVVFDLRRRLSAGQLHQHLAELAAGCGLLEVDVDLGAAVAGCRFEADGGIHLVDVVGPQPVLLPASPDLFRRSEDGDGSLTAHPRTSSRVDGTGFLPDTRGGGRYTAAL